MPCDPWEAINARRLALLDKLFDVGLTPDELAELDALQLRAGQPDKLPFDEPASWKHAPQDLAVLDDETA